MFEAIMLLAFLYAATCQLFPEKPDATSGSPRGRKSLSGKEKTGLLRLSLLKHQTTQKIPAKAKNRSFNYARVA